MNEWTFATVSAVFMFCGIGMSEYLNHACRVEAVKAGITAQQIKEICK